MHLLHISKYKEIKGEALKTLFLKGVLEEYIDALNLIASGYICQKNFEKINDLCRTYSRNRGKMTRSVRDPIGRDLIGRNTEPSTSSGVTRVQLGNLL